MNAIPVHARRRGGQRSMGARLCAMLAMLMLAIAAWPAAAQGADDELPGRVGRIADVGGQLFYSPPDQPTAWASIGINYPITSGDNLWVSGDGRVEVDYGGGQFRLAGDTNLHVSRLDDRQVALFVAQGRVIVRVRYLDPGEMATVDTPNTQVQLTRPGLYRVDVFPDLQQTSAIVREGEALVALVNGAQQVLPGQVASVRGQSPDSANVQSGVGIDGFDAWSADRERHYERSRSSAYVSRQMVGWADLDAYGSWQTYPEYGAVWFPTTVSADWAPYRDGYWASVGGWGWTWVDAAPWGFAPSHYGRWVSFRGRWGWCPGGYVARPVWAPALVAWFGGAGWGFSTTIGSPVYGWVPLGWRDPVRPWWGGGRCGDRCWTHFNRPFGVNQADFRRDAPIRFSNFHVPGAVTAVPGATMTQGRPVFRNRVEVPPSAIAAAPPMAEAPAFRPALTPAARPGGNVPAPASSLIRAGRPTVVPPDAAARPPAAAGAPAGGGAGQGGAMPPRPTTGGGTAPGRLHDRGQGGATAPLSTPAAVPTPAPAVAAPPAATFGQSGAAAPSRPREAGGAGEQGRDRGQGPGGQSQSREGRGAAGGVAAPPAIAPAPAVVPAPAASAPAMRGRTPPATVPSAEVPPVQGRGAASVPASPYPGGQGSAAPAPRTETRPSPPRAPAVAAPPTTAQPSPAVPAAAPRPAPQVRHEPQAAPPRPDRGIPMPPATGGAAQQYVAPAAPQGGGAAPPSRAPSPQAGTPAPQAGRGQGTNTPVHDKGAKAPPPAESAGAAAPPPR